MRQFVGIVDIFEDLGLEGLEGLDELREFQQLFESWSIIDEFLKPAGVLGVGIVPTHLCYPSNYNDRVRSELSNSFHKSLVVRCRKYSSTSSSSIYTASMSISISPATCR
jgi:hypothetical protein